MTPRAPQLVSSPFTRGRGTIAAGLRSRGCVDASEMENYGRMVLGVRVVRNPALGRGTPELWCKGDRVTLPLQGPTSRKGG